MRRVHGRPRTRLAGRRGAASRSQGGEGAVDESAHHGKREGFARRSLHGHGQRAAVAASYRDRLRWIAGGLARGGTASGRTEIRAVPVRTFQQEAVLRRVSRTIRL